MFARKRETAEEIYHSALAQARAAGFYGPGRIPDTVEGRFEVLMLHVFFVVDALGARPDAAGLSQEVFDAFFSDMDAALREMGVGDLSVAKKIKAMSEAFYGRAKAYREGLAEGDEALAAALARNLFVHGEVEPAFAEALQQYVRQTDRMLAPLRREKGSNRPSFPPPPG